ncbi:PHP domain-containing protein [Chloroflexota bacterium]
MNRCEDPTFRKADLHIHTPRSVCYSDKSVTPEQIIDTALASNLEVIAITDHNTVATIDAIRHLAHQKDIFLFPGIELSTRGGHLLALFDTDTPRAELNDFLDYVGVARGGWGDAINLTQGGMEEVCEKIDERGGIAVAAHVERWPSGFLETNEPHRVKMSIHSNRYLNALELTIPQNKGLWNTGQVRDYPKKHACIQGSDAHALDEIGRRPVYIRMKTVGLAALRKALIDHETSIIFPDECEPGK